MIKILFVCHGNICRSPMAEFVMKDMVKRQGLADQFYIASAATSTEEIGNPVHYGTRNKLAQVGISTAGKYAVRMERRDYQEYDYIVGMDRWNYKNMLRISGNKDKDKKISLLLDYTDHPRDVADPWYTGDFEKTYEDIMAGCKGLLEHIQQKGLV
ncbi:MAG: low molecular weight phosphotyrosine protein phosphatase [Lachnospiraceae bacterium]|nr:low molecular weight phosphotyrosine protein phosphatase [Lachnospiraceae bacterium]MCI9647720.1 low molecular weight phosphotyrosine protein phosphatase [Lachnospiraceae bacterium]